MRTGYATSRQQRGTGIREREVGAYGRSDVSWFCFLRRIHGANRRGDSVADFHRFGDSSCFYFVSVYLFSGKLAHDYLLSGKLAYDCAGSTVSSSTISSLVRRNWDGIIDGGSIDWK